MLEKHSLRTLISLSHNIEGIVGLVAIGAMVWTLRAYFDRRDAARSAKPRKKNKLRVTVKRK